MLTRVSRRIVTPLAIQVRNNSTTTTVATTDSTLDKIIANVDTYNAEKAKTLEPSFFGGLKDIIKEYGVYPFVGLGVFALLSKELFYFNTEFLVFCNTTGLAIGGYILAADSVKGAVNDARKEALAKVLNVYKAREDVIKAHIECCESTTKLPFVIAETHKAFLEANAAAAKARDLKARKAFRDAIITKLTQAKNAEEEAINAKKEALRSASLDYVMKQIKESTELRAAVLKEAISLVGATEDKRGSFIAIDNLIDDYVKKASKQ